MNLIEGTPAARAAVLAANALRRFGNQPLMEARVRDICDAVRDTGDEALLANVREFDCPTLQLAELRVTDEEREDAWASLTAPGRQALEHAAQNIREFHQKQPCGSWFYLSPAGSLLGQRFTPIDRVALYAPNGRATYPSTVLMLGVPAQVAGVPQVVLATPAGRDGKADAAVLAAAHLAGIHEIYKIGGAAAVAALAHGTPTVPRVDKFVGPGSIYVTLAKKYLYGVVGIDGLYGPSEVVVVAEPGAASPAQLAADLLAQAEHGPDSFVAFVSPSGSLCREVLRELEAQTAASPRADYLQESLGGALILCSDTLEDACVLASLCAAEHVELWARDPLALLPEVTNAGAIFLNTPVPLGDYIAGPSHTLPTGGTARFAAGVGVDTFLKRTTVLAASQADIASQAGDLEIIAAMEQLPGHAAAIHRSVAARKTSN